MKLSIYWTVLACFYFVLAIISFLSYRRIIKADLKIRIPIGETGEWLALKIFLNN